MVIHKTKDFVDEFAELPAEIRRLYRKHEVGFLDEDITVPGVVSGKFQLT